MDGFWKPLQILEEQLRVAGFVDDDKHFWEVRTGPEELLDVLVSQMPDEKGAPEGAPEHKP